MKIIGIIWLLALTLPVASTGAEVYRYTDQHGNVIFTDDLSNIPDQLRDKAVAVDDENDLPPGFGAGNAAASDAGGIDLRDERAQLEALKSELKEEFRSLAKENARLKEAQKTAVTPDQRKVFNRQVVGFNTRFQAYKEKEAVYNSRLKQYHKRLNAVPSNPDH